MNKDDFDRFWTACVPREARASNENIFDDVIKAIDNSEKYRIIAEDQENIIIKKNDEIRISRPIVERLKAFFNGDNVLTKSEYKQKILGDMDLTFATPNPTGEYKITDNPKWKTCCKDTGEEKDV